MPQDALRRDNVPRRRFVQLEEQMWRKQVWVVPGLRQGGSRNMYLAVTRQTSA